MMKTGFAIALFLGAAAAHGAGLGKLTVNSALGQPLNAEIDLVSLQPGELESLTARVAPPEAFRDARIEYSSSLRLLRFSVEKRQNGQPYLKVTSIGPINEPFVDALIEVSWPQGRLQREYPILLDPPGYSQSRVAAPTVPAAPTSRAPDTPPATAPAASSSQPASPAPAATTPPTAGSGTPSAQAELVRTPSGATEAPSGSGGDTYGPVQKGDTLRKIAEETKPSNVSLEQMLVALYRENKSAFVNNNMNRLKAGQILKVPTAEQATAIERKEVNEEIRTHVADWKAYREQVGSGVASLPPRAETSSASGGRIGTAAVTPPAPPAAESKDVLKLSKSEKAGKGTAGKAGGADRATALQEELTAKEKALQESQSRVADLEKQIRDMQRLLDLKTGAPGKTDSKVAAVPPAPTKAEPAKPAAPATPLPTPDTKLAEAPKTPTPTPPAPTATTTPPKAPEPAKVDPVKPGEPAKTDLAKVEPPKTDTKLAEAPKPATPPPATPPPGAPKAATPPKTPPKKAPPPPKSFTDELLENPVYLGLIGLGIAGLGVGAFLFMRRRKQQAMMEGSASSMGSSAFPSDLKVDSTTGKAGGGLVDTGNSSFLTDFDKTGPGTIDTDEVDPVAEAEVYIAYGRDAQAEEILKEAMARDSSRPEIALKLLEIYHARKSATAFEGVAKQLHAQVGDSHPMWHKAAAMGAQIDSANPLYAAAAGAGAAAAATYAASAPAPAAKPNLDFDVLGSSAGGGAAPAPDFDLNADATKPAETSSTGMDFDIHSDDSPASAASQSVTEPAKEEKPSFDFDLSGLDFPGTPKASSGTDLEVDPTKPAASSASSSPALDLTDLSLDSPSDSGGDSGGGAEGVGTKLELAKAYLEIGDKDGAREILNEVAKEGSAAQREEAQKLISQL